MRIAFNMNNFKFCLSACAFLLFFPVFSFSQVIEQESKDSSLSALNKKRFNETLEKSNNPSLIDTNIQRTRVRLKGVSRTPQISLQQYLKGNRSGLFVREENGEPGSEQFMFIRGLNSPLFTKQDLYSIQPVVYLNGIPLGQENGFTYNIQRYDFNKLGSGTNLLSILDINNIGSIEVLKTPADVATLGALGSNGAIWVTTKNAQSLSKPLFNVDTYIGMLQPARIETINAEYENNFRRPYYDKFANDAQRANYPLYVANTFDPYYYGSANWSDLYYKAKPIYYTGFGITGGTDRANFRFNVSDTKDRNFDSTSFDRYTISFGMNMVPLKWLTISSNINAARINRARDRSLRDRFAESRFVPDLSNPLAPNKEAYRSFLTKYNGSVDKNTNNSIIGGFSAVARFGDFEVNSTLSVDYEESLRDVFWGKSLMDQNSFLSTFFGFNQRTSVNNSLRYHLPAKSINSSFNFEAGQHYVSDFYKYDYVLGYNTPNDFIKIKNYYDKDIFAYPFSDNLKARLSSYYARFGYSYKNILHLNGVARYEGYSSFSPTDRWLLTPVVSARLNLDEFIESKKIVTELALKGSWGVFGKLLQDNRFKFGPQYRVDVGYADEPVIGSYGGFPGISQTYSFGWISQYYNWPFAERLNVGADLGFLRNRLMLGIDYYRNNEKNMLVPTSLARENGFNYKWVQGLAVQNSGINFDLTVNILKGTRGLRWDFFANAAWNKNKLTKLPYGLNEIRFGDMKLKIGEPIDAFWVYENTGIINTPADAPVFTTPLGAQEPVTFGGTMTFAPGDPIWKDNDNNGIIDENDKVLKGHSMPVYTGGFGSALNYRGFTLDFQFFYALGQQLLNQATANKLDFINTENSNNISAIKEITFWQKTFDYKDYPMYNPWSGVMPYRLDQDLFLKNADFMKLRYLTIGYDLSARGYLKRMKFSKALLYVTGNNLFTISSFSEGDPEQVSYRGIYTGRYLPLVTSYSIGLKLNF
jgi:TonB-linked SusC/RagA family outer membrane protein